MPRAEAYQPPKLVHQAPRVEMGAVYCSDEDSSDVSREDVNRIEPQRFVTPLEMAP